LNPVENYFRELRDIRLTGAGVPEESYYAALSNLLNEIGKTLKPKVRCVLQLTNRGAGKPDGGLFTSNQFQKASSDEPIPGQLPERGVIEVKPFDDDTWVTAGGKQVSNYWDKYGLVLVTNYRDFVLVGKSESGKSVKLETFRLTPNEADFRIAIAYPHKFTVASGDRLREFLRRVMLHAAPLSNPEDLAWFLASYAKEAKARIEAVGELPGLAALRKGLEDALGLTFEGDNGEHFFRATLVQTLFYGIFSSWVLWARNNGATKNARFSWHEAAWNLHVPMIASLFDQIATPRKLKSLGIDEVLDWTGMVLNRVVRAEFFKKFEEDHAVQYFYEPFLKAYDPQLRKDLGVWYTPPEIVEYQVARVDTVLREELEIEDGLADPNVIVLDPCCGTGAYLVEVLRKIHKTLQGKSDDALTAQRLKKAAMERVFGFELLPAPFVVAHLQLGLMLRNLGTPLSDKTNERAGVYLTNALTGWEPPKEPKKLLPFPELQEEHDAAEKVKSDAKILVILGNPPYNAFAGTSPEEEQGLVEPYKQGLTKPISEGGWGIKKFNLDDLYIRFFRVAERRIVKSGKGIVSYISNHSWVSDPSFVVMRQHLLNSFDKFWIENLHGNRKISEYAPDGRTSETVFAIPGFSAGIQQGIVTSLWIKSGKRKTKQAKVVFRDDIHAAKAVERRKQLLDSLNVKNFSKKYKTSKPKQNNRYSFRPQEVSDHYLSWPKVVDLCEELPSNGLMEKRGGSLIDIDKSSLEKRMRTYYNKKVNWDSLTTLGMGLTKEAARFKARQARDKVLTSESYTPENLRRYALRPFDNRWCYYSSIRPLWNEPRPSYAKQCWDGNSFFMTRFRSSSVPEGTPCYLVTSFSDDHFIMPDNSCFPIRLLRVLNGNEKGDTTPNMFGDDVTITANLSGLARVYLKSLGIGNPDKDTDTAGLIWMHALAIGYSPAYLSENADGVRQDWPRIPLPDSKNALMASAKLGKQVAALLDTEKSVSRVSSGSIRPELKVLGLVCRVGEGALNPDAGDLDLTAGWGHAGKAGVTMPGGGRIQQRPYSDKEMGAIEKGAKSLGLTVEQALKNLGKSTRDIYLNDIAYWKNVPENVWNYYIGGYQVIKKWLSYREKVLLSRSMKIEEVEYVTEMTRRITAILLLQSHLDRNYRAIKKSPFNWSAAVLS